MQSRWKSKVLWAAIIAILLDISRKILIVAGVDLDVGPIGEILLMVLDLAAVVGIVNNPTDPARW